ncbi:(deoxy)nucleoside triphosphate pyrophosphohydrolase [Pseudarthrobacter sp. J1763]|uniref:(deoxy)nucleoside triphosphate pyrophosphohydrolase n=1 Tax=Pseudarthrobacter sp. J1763 TaxID=3420445 RepID=UPI003D2DE0D2
MTKTIHVVAAAICDSLNHPTKLLIAQRSAPPKFAGMWEFPGGKVEAGETDRNALTREIREELGVEIALGAAVLAEDPMGWPLNEKAVMRVWLGEITEGEPAALEDHHELRWVHLADPEGIMALPWIPADLPIVEALLKLVAA